MKRPHLVSILMTVGAALLWSSSFSVAKVGLRYIDPYSFVLLRFLLASAVLLGLVVLTGHGRRLGAYLKDRYALILGITLAASFGLQFRGQTETTAAKAAIIINASVVFVAPLGLLFLKERIGPRAIAALCVGLVGVYLVTKARVGSAEEGGTLAGNLLVAGSSLSYAVYVVFSKMAVTRRDVREIPFVTSVFLWSLPIFFLVSLPRLASGLEVGREAWLATGYLAVFCSVLPFLLYTAAIKHISALTSAVVLLAELVFGVIIAFLLLSESLATPAWIGCGLICAGIFIAGTRPQPTNPTPT
jgi:drug/metabolite transporter (DMT)-like permease